MADPKRTLTPDEIDEEGLADWRRLLTGLAAQFATGDFAAGLALVQRIGAAAEEANHHPDVTLTYPHVRVVLASHDVGGITSRDIDLARRISDMAAEAGISADPRRQTEVELCLDTTSEERVAPFYAALLGKESVPWWMQEPGGDGTDLPQADPPQRWHLDVWVPADEAESRLQEVLAAGGRLVSDAEAPSFWVIEDSDGNRSCICSQSGR